MRKKFPPPPVVVFAAKKYDWDVPCVMIAAGEVAQTASGRTTTPFPKSPYWRNRLKIWLRVNAIDEARYRDDDFNLCWLETLPDKLTDGQVTFLNQYLFGDYERDRFKGIVLKDMILELAEALQSVSSDRMGQ